MEAEQYYTILTYKNGDKEEVVKCDLIELDEDKYDFLKMKELISENNPFNSYLETEVSDKGDGKYVIETYENYKVIDSIQVTVKYAHKLKGHFFELKKLYI